MTTALLTCQHDEEAVGDCDRQQHTRRPLQSTMSRSSSRGELRHLIDLGDVEPRQQRSGEILSDNISLTGVAQRYESSSNCLSTIMPVHSSTMAGRPTLRRHSTSERAIRASSSLSHHTLPNSDRSAATAVCHS